MLQHPGKSKPAVNKDRIKYYFFFFKLHLKIEFIFYSVMYVSMMYIASYLPTAATHTSIFSKIVHAI